MSFNTKKSNVMWFIPWSQRSAETPPVILDGSPLMSIATQKYLGVVIDSDLCWSSHISALCKKMAYYLYLIGYHQRNLPVAVLKMLIQSLVLSHRRYAMPVWGPSLSHDLQSRLEKCSIMLLRLSMG